MLEGQKIRISAMGLVSCLGHGRAEHLAAMRAGRCGLRPCDWPDLPFDCHAGAVAGVEHIALPAPQAAWQNRATQLAEAALRTDGFAEAVIAARERWGPARIAIVLGTSTSGVERLETVWRDRPAEAPLDPAYSLRHHNDHHAVTAWLAVRLGIEGPGWTVSTACSSGLKALFDAAALLATGLADAVVTGGVDSLCLTSLNGFHALGLVSRQPCRPCDRNRDGISIGEAAGLMLVERGADGLRLTGIGESSDASSMSTPPPDGAGARRAMEAALASAGLRASEIDHVNLHGTATPSNDVAECRAVEAVFGRRVPCSSLKGAIGHTLGAAGGIETVMSAIALEEGLLPGTTGLVDRDPEIACEVLRAPETGRPRHVLTSAFGFGGSNAAAVLSLA